MWDDLTGMIAKWSLEGLLLPLCLAASDCGFPLSCGRPPASAPFSGFLNLWRIGQRIAWGQLCRPAKIASLPRAAALRAYRKKFS